MFGDGVVKFCNRLAKASGLGVGIFGAVVFSSGGIASSALGQRQLTLFFLQDDSSHVDPLVVTCGRNSNVSLCIEGFEIHVNSD